jgi:hypothetical protein
MKKQNKPRHVFANKLSMIGLIFSNALERVQPIRSTYNNNPL